MTDGHPDGDLVCPKCGAAMRKLRLADEWIDRCESCFGVWLDDGERLPIIADSEVAEVVDVGDAKTGARQDRITDVDCPRCAVPMEHRRHPDQKHVTFERCPECLGSYFDAGELRDLSRLTIADVVRNFLR